MNRRHYVIYWDESTRQSEVTAPMTLEEAREAANKLINIHSDRNVYIARVVETLWFSQDTEDELTRRQNAKSNNTFTNPTTS